MIMGTKLTGDVVEVLRVKAADYRRRAQAIEDIVKDMQLEEPQANVLELVVAALAKAPERKLPRKAIIQHVKQTLPGLPHIAVVSTLHKADLFKRIGKDEYQLREDRGRHLPDTLVHESFARK